jgi:hypothetical protein
VAGVSKHSIKGERCVRCGAVEGLVVDYITPVSLFDDDDWDAERQYDMLGLVTLCRLCDNEKDNRRGLAQAKVAGRLRVDERTVRRLA